MSLQGPVSNWPVSHRVEGAAGAWVCIAFSPSHWPTGSRSAWFLAGAGCMTQFFQGLPSHSSGCRPLEGTLAHPKSERLGQLAAHPRRLCLEAAVTRSQWALATCKRSPRPSLCALLLLWVLVGLSGARFHDLNQFSISHLHTHPWQTSVSHPELAGRCRHRVSGLRRKAEAGSGISC